jgi:hypothetical protein
MIKADSAQVAWDAEKKHWIVRLKIGEEVVKRPCAKSKYEVDEQVLREMAITTARDDGYDLDASSISVQR